MFLILRSLTLSLLSAFRSRRTMAVRILILEHQVRVLKRRVKRPRFTDWDRALWVAISRTWTHWRAHFHLVRPETVVDWHHRRFRRYWTRKSRAGRRGRPSVTVEIRQLIRKMARANVLWGAPRGPSPDFVDTSPRGLAFRCSMSGPMPGSGGRLASAARRAGASP